jgi:hypothetical protein
MFFFWNEIITKSHLCVTNWHPKLGKSFEMACSWLKWLHLRGFSNYALIGSNDANWLSTFQLLHRSKKFLLTVPDRKSTRSFWHCGSHFGTRKTFRNICQLRDPFLTYCIVCEIMHRDFVGLVFVWDGLIISKPNEKRNKPQRAVHRKLVLIATRKVSSWMKLFWTNYADAIPQCKQLQ